MFTTAGGSILFTATRFPHGQPFDPAVGRTQMLLGRADDPPRYDPGAGTVTNASYRVDLVENQPTIVTLPAGRYWIVNSNGVWITAQACTRRLSDIRRL